ncbi:FkbM family methyltransferase [Methyloterricola oryzae]|uniref:FkbM family methyltransferase n=1 Tax=Methyloterricola oryzae TaxID=1495050 RepID=UPI001301084F|nr:FkbM family methyltransferase [Methyloterricola oryzae]
MYDGFIKLKRIANVLRGKDFYPVIDARNVPIEHFGGKYGGWDLSVEHLSSESIVYSVGVGEDISFDLDLIKSFQMKVHAFDPTPKSIEWIKSQTLPDNFIHYPYGVADFDGVVQFNPPENEDHVSHTILSRPGKSENGILVPVKCLRSIMSELGHTSIDLLKMDIEGAEYCVIEDMNRCAIRPKQILIEFHHRFPGVGVRRTKQAVGLLKAMGYSLFSVSKAGEEYSFLLSP